MKMKKKTIVLEGVGVSCAHHPLPLHPQIHKMKHTCASKSLSSISLRSFSQDARRILRVEISAIRSSLCVSRAVRLTNS